MAQPTQLAPIPGEPFAHWWSRVQRSDGEQRRLAALAWNAALARVAREFTARGPEGAAAVCLQFQAHEEP